MRILFYPASAGGWLEPSVDLPVRWKVKAE
jgi:hypothetical protein